MNDVLIWAFLHLILFVIYSVNLGKRKPTINKKLKR